MKPVACAVALLCLSGCFIRESRMQETLEPWVGRDIHEAIGELGPPMRRHENGSTVIYQWRYTGGSHAVAYQTGWVSNADAWTETCDVWLTTDRSGRVRRWRWQGYC